MLRKVTWNFGETFGAVLHHICNRRHFFRSYYGNECKNEHTIKKDNWTGKLRQRVKKQRMTSVNIAHNRENM